MNLNKFDMVVLVVMPLAIIGMSFTMPALGLGSSDVSDNEIPAFDIQADRFDLVGDFPDDPTTASSGSLEFDTSAESNGDSAVWLRDTIQLGLVDYQPYGEPPVQVRLSDLGEPEVDPIALSEEGDTHTLEVTDWEVEVELDRVYTEGDGTVFVVDYEVLESPEDEPDGILEAVFSMIPGAGIMATLIAETGPIQGVVAAVMYIVSILMWFSGTLNEVIFNLMFALFDLSTFFISLVGWLFTTYSDLITGAPAWAAVFVSIPGILLSIVLGKVTFVLVSLFPTT